jgi:Fe-S cluster biogenesis protein NfuA
MANSLDGHDFGARLRRLDSLIQEVERFPDPAMRSHTREIVKVLLDLHGVGLEKVLEQVADKGEVGQAIIDELARDDLVSSLLLLHGLHPIDLQTRVGQALIKVRPYLRSHGGNVELLGMTAESVRLRMDGTCHGCPSSAATIKQTIEQAIFDAAPEIASIELENLEEPPAPIGLVQLGILPRRNGIPEPVAETTVPI